MCVQIFMIHNVNDDPEKIMYHGSCLAFQCDSPNLCYLMLKSKTLLTGQISVINDLGSIIIKPYHKRICMLF
jgi:hypothetical protein